MPHLAWVGAGFGNLSVVKGLKVGYRYSYNFKIKIILFFFFQYWPPSSCWRFCQVVSVSITGSDIEKKEFPGMGISWTIRCKYSKEHMKITVKCIYVQCRIIRIASNVVLPGVTWRCWLMSQIHRAGEEYFIPWWCVAGRRTSDSWSWQQGSGMHDCAYGVNA